MTPEQTYVRNCLIHPRRDGAGAEAMFTLSAEHGVQCQLDGYAIVPRDEYERLKQLAGEDKQPLVTALRLV